MPPDVIAGSGRTPDHTCADGGPPTFGVCHRVPSCAGRCPRVPLVAEHPRNDLAASRGSLRRGPSDLCGRLGRRPVASEPLIRASVPRGRSIALSGRAGLMEGDEEDAGAPRRRQPWPGEELHVVVRVHPEPVTGFLIDAPGAP